jgi:hypothetical protein
VSLAVFGLIPSTALSADLSKYREFQLGDDLATVLQRTGVSALQTKAIHVRPARIEELDWHPQSFQEGAYTDAADDITFSFYNGELFRIVVTYDHYQTEGLTTADLVEAISASYGPATKLSAPAKVAHGPFDDQEEVLARWQDTQYRYDLIRSAYGPGFRLIGVLIKLEVPARAAILEAKRLDTLEAPQRDAARIANEDEATKAKLEKARLVNKAKFRP